MMRHSSQGRHVRACQRGSLQDSRTRRWIGAVGAVAVAVALPAALQMLGQGVASAATVPAATVVSAITPFDSTATKTIAAQCPAGKRVIGGGARVNGAQHVVLTQEQPVHTSAGDSYVVVASEDQIGFTGTWALQAYAICADPLPGLQIVSATSAAGSGAFEGVSASCPSGQLAIGAGGRINSGQGQVDLSTLAEGGIYATRTTATGTEDLDGFAGTWSVTAFAVCVTPTLYSDLRLVKVQTASDSTDRKITEARCPLGKKVTGGAAYASTPGVIESVSPDANRLAIQVIARENSPTTASWYVVAAAFCAS